jgi:iron complex transport system substrate-binding protein
MRIVSLTPSATEIVAGLVDDPGELVGVTHECDWPEWVRDLPKLVRPFDERILDAEPEAVDEMVREASRAGRPLYVVDEDLMRRLEPDLVVSQSLCDVCAAEPGDAARVAAALRRPAEVLELAPASLADVLDDVVRVGRAIGKESAALAWRSQLRERLERVRSAPRRTPAPKVLLLEWPDPPWVAGHWAPEMVEAAGGLPVCGRPGAPSRRLEWDEAIDADPDVVLVACCGYDQARNARQIRDLEFNPQWRALAAVKAGRVHPVDANSYVSRPGPRLIDGVEILYKLLQEA